MLLFQFDAHMIQIHEGCFCYSMTLAIDERGKLIYLLYHILDSFKKILNEMEQF